MLRAETETIAWLKDTHPAGAWAGQPIAVLARGLGREATPSLAEFPGRVLGVNSAGAWHSCDIAASADSGFWDEDHQGLDLGDALRVYIDTHPRRADCRNVRAQQRRHNRRPRWPTDYGRGIVTGGSSGLAVLGLADVLGAGRSPIYLIGHVLREYRYSTWRARYEEIADAVADRCVVIGDSDLSPRWPRGVLPRR
jgi:hypothetical protein